MGYLSRMFFTIQSRNWNRLLGNSALLWKQVYERVVDKESTTKRFKAKKKHLSANENGRIDWKALVRNAAPPSDKCGCGAMIRHYHGIQDYECRRFCPEGLAVMDQYLGVQK